MSNANEHKQEQRIRIKKLPLVSLASGVLVPILIFISAFIPDSVLDSVPDSVGFIHFWLIFLLAGFGIICGIYCLIMGKLEYLVEIVCAVLGIFISGLWFLYFIGLSLVGK